MITQETIQQIQSRIDVVDIVGNFVKLKKRGANYLGLCPFHNEKTPSFTVSAVKGIYKCFGCGKSGNGISFVMEHEKYTYVETLKWLAARYNIEIEETEVSPEVKLQQQTAQSLFILNEYAAKFFQEQLNEEQGQTIALSYLEERGFRKDIIEKFQLGYAPADGYIFAETALKAQYSKSVLLKSGLVTERNEKLADNYRNRIIFPIHNQSGKILGFGARVIGNSDKGPKYINTPENDIYIKSRILYGAYFARQAIDKLDECLLVEGYTDVISLHQAGVENVVASGGTSLTPDQLRLIKKFTNNLTILYDGDSAGVKAALRGMDLAIEEGLEVKLVLLPDNEDPDSYVRNQGGEQLRKFVAENKKDFILFQLEIELKDAGNDAQKKSQVVNKIAETIARISRPEDFIRRQSYITQVSQILKIEEAGLLTLINKFVRDKISKSGATPFQEKSSIDIPVVESEDTETLHLLSKDDPQEEAVLRTLIDFGLKEYDGRTVAEYIFQELEENELTFDKEIHTQIFNQFKSWYQEGKLPDRNSFTYHEDDQIRDLVIKILDIQTEISPKWAEFHNEPILSREEMYRTELESSLLYFKLRKVKKLLAESQAAIEHATGNELTMQLNFYKLLKENEMLLTKSLGAVIIK